MGAVSFLFSLISVFLPFAFFFYAFQFIWAYGIIGVSLYAILFLGSILLLSIVLYRLLAKYSLLGNDALHIATLKVWLASLALFLPAAGLAFLNWQAAVDGCHADCGPDPYCSAHCNTWGQYLVFIYVVLSAIVGPHNPITFFASSYISKKYLGR